MLFTLQFIKSIVGDMSHFSHKAPECYLHYSLLSPLSAACLTLVMRSQNAFRNSPTSMSLTSTWTLFFSWSMFDASPLPAYTACFRLSIKHSTGCSWGTFGGLEVFGPSCTLCSWKSSKHSLPLFQGWRGCMDFLSLVECYAILPEGLSVADSWNTTCSWILNQASCSWPLSGDLTRHLRACAGGWGWLFQIQPSSLLFFYPQMTGEHM